MKELTNHHQLSKEIVIPAKTETKVHQIIPKPGHTVFELNLSSKIISHAEYEAIDITGKKKKLIVKHLCIYTSALNQKNAEKKFCKMIIELKNKKN